MPGRASQASGFMLAAGLYTAAFALLGMAGAGHAALRFRGTPRRSRTGDEVPGDLARTEVIRRSGRPMFSPAGPDRRSAVADLVAPASCARLARCAAELRAHPCLTFAYLFLGGLAIIMSFAIAAGTGAGRGGCRAHLCVRRIGGIVPATYERDDHQPCVVPRCCGF